MKAKRLLAILLALCLLVSAVSTGMIMPATAASGTLGADRITYYDNLSAFVANSTVTGWGNNPNSANLFDGSLNTKAEGWFNAGNTASITIQLSEAKTVTAYTMGTNDDGNSNGRQPKTWTLSGSNDGATYTVLDSVTGYAAPNQNYVYYDDDFRVDNPGSYLYYRLDITEFATASIWAQISELVLSGYDLTDLKAVEAKIDALDAEAETYAADVAAARAAYNALGAVKAAVTNAATLIAAEEAVALANAQDAEKVAAAINAIKAIGTVTYKSKDAIDAADAAWSDLSITDKETLASFGTTLTEARDTYDAIIGAFAWTPVNNFEAGGDTIAMNAWIKAGAAADASAEMKAIYDNTVADIANSAKYAYANGRLVAASATTPSGQFDFWMSSTKLDGGWWHYKIEQGVDNYNAQQYRNNLTVATPAFPGIGFVVDTTFAQGWRFESTYALGEPFEFDGKTYQIMWNGAYFYTTTEPVGGSEVVPDVSTFGWHPDERLNAEETGKNIFRYAYAAYSSANRWGGLTYGVPQTDYSASVNNMRYQKYVGPDGVAYLLTTDEQIAAAPTDVTAATYGEEMAKAYYALTGDMANAFDKLTADTLAAAGKLVMATDTQVEFENGILTKNGYVEKTIRFDTNVVGTVADGNAKWTMNIVWDEDMTAEDINSQYFFKDYGVYYAATAENAEQAYLAGDDLFVTNEDGTKEVKLAGKVSFDAATEENDATVYTTFSFQLNGVPETGERAVLFYLTYELNGVEYTVTCSNVLDLSAK